jgi:levanase/fructan beta-fructosidase
MNVKLAVDRVDYWVPYELKNAQLLDIVFHGDRRLKGAIADFVCWKEMKLSDSLDTTNTEKYRPMYHHTPQYGWMNDPNGMFYKDGVWHLYYQFNPYGSQWENMTWGHSSSKDLIHWEAQPTAIEPDALGDIFSGSAIVDKDNTAGFGAGAIIAMYTSAGKNQTQSIAYSTDGGKTFTKYAGNPVITYPAPDFRDPKVFWHEGTKRWIVVLAAGQEVQFYSSPNMKDWTRTRRIFCTTFPKSRRRRRCSSSRARRTWRRFASGALSQRLTPAARPRMDRPSGRTS